MLFLLPCWTAGGLLYAQALPSPWASTDVGSPAVAGSAAHHEGTFTIEASGNDSWRTADEFHFAYQALAGDIDLVARVDAMANPAAVSRAGVMIRSSLAGDAAFGFAYISSSRGPGFQGRTPAGDWKSSPTFDGGASARWVRVARVGAAVTVYFSTDGIGWVPAGSIDVGSAPTAYVGLAATSNEYATTTVASLSQVALYAAVPEGMTSQDVGRPSVEGKALHAAGSYRVFGAGSGVRGLKDQFHYVFRPVTGDLDVRVRVASIERRHRWSKAGVMVRESLTARSRFAMALTSAAAGQAFQRRADTDGLSVRTAGGTGSAPVWVRLVRTGALFEAFQSSNGSSWTSMGSDVIPMGETVYVGIAVTSHAADQTAEGVFDNLEISATDSVPNEAPAVLLTSPGNGATFIDTETITLTADASDADGAVARVEFVVDNRPIGSDDTAPYAIDWSAVAAGTYKLSAIAYDDEGAATGSTAVTITVTPPVPEPIGRTVVFTASTDHTMVTRYVLEIFVAGTAISAATAVASADLGRPAPNADNDIAVEQTALFEALASGDYTAVIRAQNSAGSTRSAAVAFTR